MQEGKREEARACPACPVQSCSAVYSTGPALCNLVLLCISRGEVSLVVILLWGLPLT